MAENFFFGKNWETFVQDYLNQERITEAEKSLINFLQIDSLKDKTFLDIGCGSGLFSLAAYHLGASKVISFDLDHFSVKCCQYLREKAGTPANWEILVGSILDENFLAKLEKADIVYSWGVLHHTGKMWQAIKNAAKLVADDGLFYIAIYNKANGLAIYPDGRFGPSKFWLIEKKVYFHLPKFLQNFIDYLVMTVLILGYLFTLKNPINKIRSHKELRGMSWRVDIKDWLGGYPYEYASPDEIFKFIRKNFNFSLENLKTNNGLLNNEYLFRNKK